MVSLFCIHRTFNMGTQVYTVRLWWRTCLKYTCGLSSLEKQKSRTSFAFRRSCEAAFKIWTWKRILPFPALFFRGFADQLVIHMYLSHLVWDLSKAWGSVCWSLHYFTPYISACQIFSHKVICKARGNLLRRYVKSRSHTLANLVFLVGFWV